MQLSLGDVFMTLMPLFGVFWGGARRLRILEGGARAKSLMEGREPCGYLEEDVVSWVWGVGRVV